MRKVSPHQKKFFDTLKASDVIIAEFSPSLGRYFGAYVVGRKGTIGVEIESLIDNNMLILSEEKDSSVSGCKSRTYKVAAPTARKTDQEVLKEYLEEMERPYPTDKGAEEILLIFVRRIREDEPRINSGVHLVDYTMLCRDHHTMDNFYGPDYFREE